MYKYIGKCDVDKRFEAIVEAENLSTPKVLTENIPMAVYASRHHPKNNSRKPLFQYSDPFGVKQKTDVCQLGAPKVKLKAIRNVTSF